MNWKPGMRIGRYRLERELTSGGQARVWVARDWVGRRVALKVWWDEAADVAEAAQEAKHWAAAHPHPNILPIHNTFLHEGAVVLVSKYVPQGTLERWLEVNHGRVAWRRAVRVAIGILRGLEQLHKHNIVHRDLTARNIVMEGDTPRLMDMGIARTVADDLIRKSVARAAPIGASPEQLRGEYGRTSDLWSVGMLLYRMASGAEPFPFQRVEQLRYGIAHNPPEPLDKRLPEALRLAIFKALEKDPTCRWQSAQELRETLERLLMGRRTPPLKTPVAPIPHRLRRRRWLATSCVALAGAGALAAGNWTAYRVSGGGWARPAEEHYQAKRWSQAERAYREALKVDTSRVDWWARLGAVCLAQKTRSNNSEAEQALREALRRAPNDPSIHKALAEALRRQSKRVEAARLRKKAQALEAEKKSLR